MTTVVLLLLSVLLGVWRYQQVRAVPLSPDDLRQTLSRGGQWLCEGRVVERPWLGAAGPIVAVALARCTVGSFWTTRTGLVELHMPVDPDVLQSPRQPPQVRWGDTLRFWARFRPVTLFRNPGTWQMGWHRIEAGVAAVATTRSPWHVQILSAAPLGVRQRIEHFAETVQRQLATVCRGATRALPPALAIRADPACGVLAAMLLGEGSGLTEASWDAYRRTGLVHLLVVSGFHVVIIAWGLWHLLHWIGRRWLGRWAQTWVWEWSALLTLSLTWSYIFLVGAGVPVVRSGIMFSVYAAGSVLRRAPDAATSLAAAVFGLVWANPYALRSPSLQLSIAAVAGLIIGQHVFRMPTEKPWWLRIPGETVTATLAASIATLPILAYHFHVVSCLGVLTNLVLVPLISWVLLPAGLLWMGLCGIATVLPAGARAVSIGGDLLYRATHAFHHTVLRLDEYSVPWQWDYVPTGGEMLGWWLLFWLAYIFWNSRTYPLAALRRSACGLVLLAGASGAALYARHLLPWQRDELRLTILDVGQGNSALLQFPNGRNYLIDGGGIAGTDFPIGERVVVPALQALHVKHLDAVVLTHYHPDHYLGLPAVAERFHPPVLLVNGSWATKFSPGWPETLARLALADVPLRRINDDTAHWNEGEVQIRVYHPGPADTFGDAGENDRSLVLGVTYRQQQWLLTGDVEAAGERVLLAQRDFQPVDLLQVPHHGSSTSSTPEFLQALRPKIAVVSCGPWNRYRFPKPEIVARYAAVGADLYRTDTMGQLAVRTDGAALVVETWGRAELAPIPGNSL